MEYKRKGMIIVLRIKKENPNTITLKIEVSVDVEKELKEYVKVGKHHKLMDKTTTINDVVGVMLEKLLNDNEYLQLKQKYDKEMEVKRSKDRLRKQKEKEKKEQKDKDKDIPKTPHN